MLVIFTKTILSGEEGYYVHTSKTTNECFDLCVAEAEITNGGLGLLNGRETTGYVRCVETMPNNRYSTLSSNVPLFRKLSDIKMGEIWEHEYNQDKKEKRMVGLFLSREEAEKELIRSGWLDRIIEAQTKAVNKRRDDAVKEIEKYSELLSLSEKYKGINP